MPGSSVQDAVRGAVRGGTPGVQTGGDSGVGEAVIQPRAPGSQASNWELLSDPMGVDFKPYLTRLLSQVRRSWFAVWPESAKMGRSGRVAVQIRVGRNGEVLKVVFAQQSGVDALDRAAIAGISAASPFAPLPSEFRGSEIRIQLNFAYNTAR
jgi:TonB family protein